jgi:hypothetical protein
MIDYLCVLFVGYGVNARLVLSFDNTQKSNIKDSREDLCNR